MSNTVLILILLFAIDGLIVGIILKNLLDRVSTLEQQVQRLEERR